MARTRSLSTLSRLPGWPLMLDEAGACACCSLDIRGFRRAMAQGELPPPQRLAGELRWSRLEIDACRSPTGAMRDPGVDPIADAIRRAT